MNVTKTLRLDVDDERDVNRAIAEFQRSGARHEDGELVLGEGTSCMAGAILGEICRAWLEDRGRLPQSNE